MYEAFSEACAHFEAGVGWSPTVFFRNDVNQSIAVPVNLLHGTIATRVDESLRRRQRSVRWMM